MCQITQTRIANSTILICTHTHTSKHACTHTTELLTNQVLSHLVRITISYKRTCSDSNSLIELPESEVAATVEDFIENVCHYLGEFPTTHYCIDLDNFSYQ